MDLETSRSFSSLNKSEFRYYKPATVRLNTRSYFPTLTKGFGQCLVQKNRFTDRLFQSLEWFRIAHLEDFGFSPYAKLLMMHSAFEVLIQFPQYGKEKRFIEYIEKQVGSSDFYKPKGKKLHKSENTKAGRWTIYFNKLRNKIIHGGKLKPEMLQYLNSISYLEVADLILYECIAKELFNRNYFNSLVKEISYPDSKPKRINSLVKSVFNHVFVDFKDVHKVLKWIK